MPVLTDKEKLYVDRIAAISRKDKSAVIDVLMACLVSGTIELLSGRDEISIPFLCDLKIDYKDVEIKTGRITEVNLEAKPCRALVEEIIAISEGDELPSERFFKAGITKKFRALLDIED